MCGIAGIRKYGAKPIDEVMIRLLLTGLERRGNDATGVALQDSKGNIELYKDNEPAWNFVSSNTYKDWIDKYLSPETLQVIVHTRAATKGSPYEVKNNHPMFHGKSVIVHNGKLENDEEAFKVLQLERHADTDSDIFRAIIDKFGITENAIDALDKVRGSAAIAAMSPEYPGKLLVGRSGSPLTVGSTNDHFIFASEKHVIHRAMKPVIERFGIQFQQTSLDMAFGPYPDHTVWILGPEGFELHRPMKTFWGTYRDPIRKVYVDYEKRQEEWKRKAKPPIITMPAPLPAKNESKDEDVILECPTCKLPLLLNARQVSMDLNKLLCPKNKGGCGNSLGAAVKKVN
jgi:predicted glutamine amidotransferase